MKIEYSGLEFGGFCHVATFWNVCVSRLGLVMMYDFILSWLTSPYSSLRSELLVGDFAECVKLLQVTAMGSCTNFMPCSIRVHHVVPLFLFWSTELP